MPAISGHRGRITVNESNWRAREWSLAWSVMDFDITTYENFNVGVFIAGITDFVLVARCFWDTTENMFNAPLRLAPGDVVAVKLFYDKSGVQTDEGFNLPSMLVVSCKMDSGVRQPQTCELTLKPSELLVKADAQENPVRAPKDKQVPDSLRGFTTSIAP